MNCPIDGETLLMTDRKGIEIDYCPSCRGVWLDRGELDKLIATSDRLDDDEPRRSSGERSSHGDQPKKKNKKTAFLSDLFELGG
ncbi:zf-TFIIB domain-containing protein [soil metagenome]